MTVLEPSKPIYQHGDIGGVPSYSLLGKLNKAIFWPHTQLYHFFVIADYIPEENDYVILESTGKGISVGRLSWYNGKEYRIFRPSGDEVAKLGVRACRALTQFGQAKYDYRLYVKMIFGCMAVWLEHIWYKMTVKDYGFYWDIRPAELPYARDSKFICTEAANEAWRLVGHPIIPNGVIKLPSGFIEALYLRNLVEILSDGSIVAFV